MNKLEHDLLYAIDAGEEYVEGVARINCQAAAKNCLIVTEKHCMGFADFIETNPFYFHKWNSVYSTKELFELYLKQLPNE